MIKNLTLTLIFIFLLGPMFTFIHELGHAILPMINGQKVNIRVGVNSVFNFEVNKLTVSIGLNKPWVGFTNWDGDSKISYILLGPIASLALGILFLIIGLNSDKHSGLLFACSGYCLFQFLFTITPITYPNWLGYGDGQFSDGKQIIEKLNSN